MLLEKAYCVAPETDILLVSKLRSLLEVDEEKKGEKKVYLVKAKNRCKRM